MQSLPTNIYSVATVREIDWHAIESLGIPGYTLMQRAAAAAVHSARAVFPATSRCQVLCGGGNNAGDGYVVARLLANDGMAVSAVSLVDVATLSGDAETAHDDFVREGGEVSSWSGQLDPDADLLVDAILGSGLERTLSGDFAAAVEAINTHPARVHSMDIPTGIHGDNGKVLGVAVSADLTNTFVGLKTGLFLNAGPDHCGELTFDGLEIANECYVNRPVAMRHTPARLIETWLSPRVRDAHKGKFGHVLVIGGGPGMPGAARLCGEAALRAGSGSVTIATHPDHAASITSACPELMAVGLSCAQDLSPLLNRADVIAFGPGLGQTDWAKSIYGLVVESQKPAVWDADALNMLSNVAKRSENRIITPHPGEAATLLKSDTTTIAADRLGAIRSLVEHYGGVAVLKGAGTLVADQDAAPSICTAGNPGMASPGMGDTLTGIIAALVGQGVPLRIAAELGVQVHAMAGDRAATSGERGMVASDLIREIRSVVNP